MFVKDLDSTGPEHEPLYLFEDNNFYYFVPVASKKAMNNAYGMNRLQLAEIAINKMTMQVVKSRHFNPTPVV